MNSNEKAEINGPRNYRGFSQSPVGLRKASILTKYYIAGE
jgi:hypothetical protein